MEGDFLAWPFVIDLHCHIPESSQALPFRLFGDVLALSVVPSHCHSRNPTKPSIFWLPFVGAQTS